MRNKTLEVGSGTGKELPGAEGCGVLISHLPPPGARGGEWGVCPVSAGALIASQFPRLIAEPVDSRCNFREVRIW